MDDKCQRDGVFIAKVYHVSEKGKRKGTPRIKRKRKKEAKIEQTNKNIQISLKKEIKRKECKEWNYMDDCVCQQETILSTFLCADYRII